MKDDGTMWTEASLLKALQTGSQPAWDDAFRRLYPCAFAAAQHPLAGLTATEAEDVAMEALMQLVPKVSELKSWDELRALAVTIAGRRAISEKRKLTAEKRGSGQTESLEFLREKTEGLFEPADFIANLQPTELRELAALLQDAMSELEPPTPQLIREFVVDGVSYKELAARHHLPIGTVGVHLARGLKKIRLRIEKNPLLLKEITAHWRL